MIDVERLRRDTPGVGTVVHLNNAGAALMPSSVVHAIVDYLEHEAAYGGYETHDLLVDRIDDAYVAVGELIGVDPGTVSIADNATRAWDLAFYGLPLEAGDRILTTSTEYASNLAAFLDVRDRKGVEIGVVPDTPTGELDVEALATMVDERVALIAVNHMPTNGGLVNPVADVGAVARAHGVPFLLDACQTVGQLPIDMEAIGCDMLSATSRKFLRGPRGVGFLSVTPDMAERIRPPFVELETADVFPDALRLRSDRRRFETWEKNYAAIAGFAIAVRYALDVGIDAIWERVRELARHARERLGEVPGVRVRDRGAVLGAIVTFSAEARDAGELRARLAERAINVSTTTASSAPIDMDRRGISEMVRASVHAYNTEQEVDRLVDAVRDLVS